MFTREIVFSAILTDCYPFLYYCRWCRVTVQNESSTRISEPLFFLNSFFLFLRRTSDCCAHMLSSCFLVTSYLLFPLLFLSGPASLKMKHRLPSSGTSTIFMLSQTTSTHSFSWSDWGLFFLFFLSASPTESLCLPVVLVSHLLCLSSPTARLSPLSTLNDRWQRSVCLFHSPLGHLVSSDSFGFLIAPGGLAAYSSQQVFIRSG